MQNGRQKYEKIILIVQAFLQIIVFYQTIFLPSTM